MNDFIINNGYAVVLTEKGKKYVNQDIQLKLQNIETSSSQLIEQAKQQLEGFIAQQENIAKELEASLPKGVTLRDIFNTRTADKAIIFNDKIEGITKSAEQYNNSRSELQKVAGNYYNIMHKTISDFSKILFTSGGKQNALINLQAKIDSLENSVSELEKQERIFLSSLSETVKTEKDLQNIEKEFEKVWQMIKKNPPVDIQISPNGNISVSSQKNDKLLFNAVENLLHEIGGLSNDKNSPIKDLESLKKFMYNINNQRGRNDTPANRARKAYKELRERYALYLGDGKKTAYTDNKAREAIYTLLQNFIVSMGETDDTIQTQLFADTSRGEKNRKEADSFEYSVSKHSQTELAKLIPEMLPEAVRSGGELTRTIIANVGAKIADFSKEHMRKSNMDFQGLKDAQDDFHLFKEFQKMDVKDKVDDYLILTSEQNQNKYIIAFSDKLYNTYSNNERGIENLGIVDSDGANLLSSLDLLSSVGEYSFSEDIKNSLIFTMLNMSTASIYYNTTQQYKEAIETFVKEILSMYFSELAFNTSNFTKQLPNNTKTNKILYVTQANNIIVPLSTTLKGILRQLNDKDGIEELIKVKVTPDTQHDSTTLYNAALQHFPTQGNVDLNQAARWNYVAQQVAHNTLLNITYNIIALAQYYDF